MPINNKKVLKDVYNNVISEFSEMRYGSFLNLIEDGDINIFNNREEWWDYRSNYLDFLLNDFDITLESSEEDVYNALLDDGNIREYKNMIIELF